MKQLLLGVFMCFLGIAVGFVVVWGINPEAITEMVTETIEKKVILSDDVECSPVEERDSITGDYSPKFTYHPAGDIVIVQFECKPALMDYWRPAE